MISFPIVIEDYKIIKCKDTVYYVVKCDLEENIIAEPLLKYTSTEKTASLFIKFKKNKMFLITLFEPSATNGDTVPDGAKTSQGLPNCLVEDILKEAIKNKTKLKCVYDNNRLTIWELSK